MNIKQFRVLHITEYFYLAIVIIGNEMFTINYIEMGNLLYIAKIYDSLRL